MRSEDSMGRGHAGMNIGCHYGELSKLVKLFPHHPATSHDLSREVSWRREELNNAYNNEFCVISCENVKIARLPDTDTNSTHLKEYFTLQYISMAPSRNVSD